jgi:hypothetical protein
MQELDGARVEEKRVRNSFASIAEERKKIRRIETDLVDQGIKFFPATEPGGRARSLWNQIRPSLLRGGAVEITAFALGLKWHRQELKRARDILVEMALIRSREDGRFVLGRIGPFSAIDELIREEFFLLKILEGVAVAIAAITKSKTQKKRRRLVASQNSANWFATGNAANRGRHKASQN